jgi:predicted nucleic acid-binding protein
MVFLLWSPTSEKSLPFSPYPDSYDHDWRLSNKKLACCPPIVITFLVQVEQKGFLVSAKPLKFSLPDPGDEPFLEVALSARVAAIVTGNKRHFRKMHYERVRILSPAEFLRTLGAEP